MFHHAKRLMRQRYNYTDGRGGGEILPEQFLECRYDYITLQSFISFISLYLSLFIFSSPTQYLHAFHFHDTFDISFKQSIWLSQRFLAIRLQHIRRCDSPTFSSKSCRRLESSSNMFMVKHNNGRVRWESVNRNKVPDRMVTRFCCHHQASIIFSRLYSLSR